MFNMLYNAHICSGCCIMYVLGSTVDLDNVLGTIVSFLNGLPVLKRLKTLLRLVGSIHGCCVNATVTCTLIQQLNHTNVLFTKNST